MKLFRTLIFVMFALLSISLHADTLSDVDSLLKVYGENQGGKRTAIACQLISIFSDCKVFFSDTPIITDDMDTDLEDLTVWFGTGRFYTSNSYFTEALQYIERAIPLSEKQNDNSLLATMLCDKSYCLYKTSEFDLATQSAQQAADLCRSTNNTYQLTRAYLYLSLVNYALRNYDQATEIVEKAISTNALIPGSNQTDNVLGIACEIYCGAKQIDRAIECGKQAVEASRLAGSNSAIANHLTQLSYAYDRNGEYAEGLKMAEEAIGIVRSTSPLDRNQLAISLEFKGWNLLDMGRHREAADAIREAIALEDSIGNSSAVCYDYRTLYECLEPIDLRGALTALKTYTQMSDSLHAIQFKELASKANAELHVDDLEEENAAAHRQSRIILWASIIIVLVLIIAIGSLLFAFRQKRQTANALVRLNEARETFFTNVTHEFRTPLTVILGLGCELQRNQIQQPADDASLSLKEIGVTIERQGHQLLHLVNQLLDISKVKSVLGEQSWMRGDISQWLAMVSERHQELARQRGITLTYSSDVKGQESAFVPDYLNKLAGNLLSNAIKFTPEGGRIMMRLTYNEQDKSLSGNLKGKKSMTITVSDTGKGITSDILPHIFEPFYHAGNAEGTGIGLALVKQIVDSLEGSINVESKVGIGTTFTLVLPLISIDTLTSEQWNSLPSIGSEHAALIQVPEIPNTPIITNDDDVDEEETELYSILIVEDNADVASLIGRQLAGRYDLHFATDGTEGIASARRLVPDLILTDLMMPGADGLQLCRTIRSDNATSHIPIIVITAKATEADRIKGIEAGADAYLYKPFNSEELNIRIEKLLVQRQLLQKKYQSSETPAEEMKPIESQATASRPAADYTSISDAFIKQVRETVLRLLSKGQSDVDHLADELCLSPTQLRRKMKAITGQTPKKFILGLRLNKAHEMAENHPEYTLTYIAESCGFYDQSHFIKAYRETFGVAPRSSNTEKNI